MGELVESDFTHKSENTQPRKGSSKRKVPQTKQHPESMFSSVVAVLSIAKPETSSQHIDASALTFLHQMSVGHIL